MASNLSRADFDFRGQAGLQVRAFNQSGESAEQEIFYLSASLEPELFWENENRNQGMTFSPFARVDQHDDERTHFDIREASYFYLGSNYELHIGLRQIFWGKTEFQHLVDTINQFDTVEDIDNEDKLGQPMVQLSLTRDWGILDLFLLPYFRERTFPGEEGRLRFPIVIDSDEALYESSDEEQHIDYALRWSHYVGVFDFGVAWFKGTSREPDFIFTTDTQGDNPRLVPFYFQVEQLSVDGQATIDSWLLKLEAIYRETNEENYFASQSGFEYTFYGVKGNTDVGVLLEYAWDERGEDSPSPFQNDLFAGARLAFNDSQSSEILAGVSVDLDYESYSGIIEASRRFGNALKLSADLRFFGSDDTQDSIYFLRDEDHIQVNLEYYY